jgi:phosphoketolase
MNQPASIPPMATALSPDLPEKMDAYWRAANYLSVEQIYLQDNPLLETPLSGSRTSSRLPANRLTRVDAAEANRAVSG